MENKKKDELQNRREFFKKAAKGALPILGAIVLANVPSVLKATDAEPMGCRFGCMGSCYESCAGTCAGTCSNVCSRLCNGCEHSCTGTCKGYCTSASRM